MAEEKKVTKPELKEIATATAIAVETPEGIIPCSNLAEAKILLLCYEILEKLKK